MRFRFGGGRAARDRRVQELNEQGIDLAMSGELDAAAQRFKEALRVDPESPHTYCNLADVHLDLGDAPHALALYGEAIARDPRHAKAHWGRGRIRRQLRDFRGAVGDFRRFLELGGGVELGAQADAEREISELERLALLAAPEESAGGSPRAPRDARALAERAADHLASGALDPAVAACVEALRLDPEEPRAHASRGALRRVLGDPRGAVADFDRALALGDDRGSEASALLAQRGFAHKELGDWDAAGADFERALEIDPSDPDALYGRGLVHNARGAFERALDDYSAALERAPRRANAHLARGLALAALGRFAEGIADLEAYLRLGDGTEVSRAQAEETLALMRASARGT